MRYSIKITEHIPGRDRITQVVPFGTLELETQVEREARDIAHSLSVTWPMVRRSRPSRFVFDLVSSETSDVDQFSTA